MKNLTEELAREKVKLQEQLIRTIVREEIVKALQVLGRAADHEYSSTESEIAERAATVLESVAESTVHRLTCPHGKYFLLSAGSQCSRCGEPEPEPENPFEPKPLEPGCNHAFAQSEDGTKICQICGGVKTDGTR